MSKSATPRLELRDIAISYEGECILKDVSFILRENEFVSLVGPSGVGKSTLLKILASILELEQGEILVDGQVVECKSGDGKLIKRKSKQAQSRFAYMPQDDLLFPWMTLYENVRLYDKLHPHSRQHSEAEVLRLIQNFGLQGYEYSLIDKLSGGMRQRAAFLRTALCPADILLLDEPFGALDVMSRNRMQDWLAELRTTLNRTILLVTHDLEEAIYLADRVLVLSGRPATIIQSYTIDQPPAERNRDWLFKQGTLKKELYDVLLAENYHSLKL